LLVKYFICGYNFHVMQITRNQSVMPSEFTIPDVTNKPYNLVNVIGDLPSYRYYADELLCVEQVVEGLKRNPELPGVVLQKKGKFIGMVSRSKIFELLGRPYGVELFFKKPINKLFSNVNAISEIFPKDTLISAAVQKSLSRPADIRYEPLVVSFGDNDLRLVEMNDVLLAQSEQLFSANGIIERQIEIGKTLASTLELSKVLTLILEQMEAIIPFNRAVILLYQNENMEFTASRGYPENMDKEEARIMINSNEFFSTILKQQRPNTVEDATLRPDWQHIPNIAPTRSWLGVPLIQNNKVLGMFSCSRLTVDPFTPNEVKTSAIFSSQAAIALGNAGLYAEIKKVNEQLDSEHKKLQEAVKELNHANIKATRRATQLETSNQISQQIISILDIKELLSKVVSIIRDQFNYTWVSVWLVQEESESLILEACTHSSFETGTSLSKNSNTISTRVYTTGEMIKENDLIKTNIPATLSGLSFASSEASFPLRFQNKTLGVLDIQSERPQAFRMDDVGVLQGVASQIAIAIYNAKLYSELNRLSQQENAALS
jgi:GAF domain-containing protein